MPRLSDKTLSKQEGLTAERLKNICTGYLSTANRPQASLVELMQWAKNFVEIEHNVNNLRAFVHNKISIDGTFLQFCEETGLKVQALHTDAITSWTTENADEHFVGVGIFDIQCQGWRFYHCGLFHKGNQNEDEVSFFILVSNENFEKYLGIRNAFEDWQRKRERESQEIEVIGGSPISYDLDIKWEDVFLPEALKTRIKTTVDGFLKSKDIYKKLNVPWRASVGFWGSQGVGKTSMIRLLIAQYQEFKPVTIQSGGSSLDEALGEAFAYAEEHAPSLLFFEDLQEMLKHVDMQNFLQLLDGLQKRDGIFTIVTGNDFSDLEENLKSRPRRIDRFFEFPLPNLKLTKKYLTKYFGDILSPKKIEALAKDTVKNKLTYAHLQEIYFNAVFIAIPEGRETPSEADVNLSIKQVMEEKEAVDSDFYTSRKLDLTQVSEEEEKEEEEDE